MCAFLYRRCACYRCIVLLRQYREYLRAEFIKRCDIYAVHVDIEFLEICISTIIVRGIENNMLKPFYICRLPAIHGHPCVTPNFQLADTKKHTHEPNIYFKVNKTNLYILLRHGCVRHTNRYQFNTVVKLSTNQNTKTKTAATRQLAPTNTAPARVREVINRRNI